MEILKNKLNGIDFHSEYVDNKPFPHIVLKNIFSDELLENVVGSIKKINKDEGGKVWYKFCTSGNDFSRFGEKVTSLMDYLISPEWINFISEIISLVRR